MLGKEEFEEEFGEHESTYLDEGGQSVIRIMTSSKDEKDYVIKEVSCKEQTLKYHLLEAEALLKLRKEPGIVKVYEVYHWQPTLTKHEFRLKMEVLKGSLRDLIDQNVKMNDYDFSLMMRQIVETLLRLKKLYSLYHRDIKPDNIMVNQLGEFVLIDFGVSKQSSDESQSYLSTSRQFSGLFGAGQNNTGFFQRTNSNGAQMFDDKMQSNIKNNYNNNSLTGNNNGGISGGITQISNSSNGSFPQFNPSSTSSSQIPQPAFKKCHSLVGTPFYFSPQLQDALSNKEKQAEHDPEKTDVYALGMTLLEAYFPISLIETEQFGFLSGLERQRAVEDYMKRIQNPTLRDILESLIKYEEEDRPTWRVLLERINEFIQQLREDMLAQEKKDRESNDQQQNQQQKIGSKRVNRFSFLKKQNLNQIIFDHAFEAKKKKRQKGHAGELTTGGSEKSQQRELLVDLVLYTGVILGGYFIYKQVTKKKN